VRYTNLCETAFRRGQNLKETLRLNPSEFIAYDAQLIFRAFNSENILPTLHSNGLQLIQELEQLPLLDQRYSNLKCVNVDAITGETRGCFSLVFKGHDQLENKSVALKFYNIDPLILLDQYRIAAFRREPVLLQTLLGKKRCLQLAASLKEFQLNFTYANGVVGSLPCLYFAVDWVDEEIDAFFARQHEFPAIDKLRLFNEIVLGIEMLHAHEIHHRDIKPDNLRAYQDLLKRIVVAIDLGTAARSDSSSLLNHYDQTVGAQAYSAPEAFCGLAGHRRIAPLTDIYALGCLLYQLFNRDLFWTELLRQNPNYGHQLSILITQINQVKAVDEKVTVWDCHVGILSSLSRVQMDASSNTMPPAIKGLLSDLLLELTHPDYKRRESSLTVVRKRIWSAIRVLENGAAAEKRILRTRERKRQRIERNMQKDERLAKFLVKELSRIC
jgi:serine/threonine protein kinase